MTDRELMQMALDALEYAADEIGCPNDDDSIGIARKALRARLAQPEQGVQWDASAPLVVHPHPAFQATLPQREWQGLTDEEMMMIYGQNHEGKKYSFGRAIEQALKEKNT